MNIHELSDLDADALTITTRGAHTWVTCTSEGEEVTVGPFPTQKLTSALPRHGDDMDGGVAAALIEKEVDRADALAKLEALGDDGTALRCAVMIAQAGAGEATVAEFCEQIARGDDVNVAARAERAEHLAKEHAATIEEQAALIEHLRAEKSECPDPEVHEGGPFDLAVIFRDERDEARAMAALWKKTAREHIGRARTALSYADAAQLARAVASVTPCSCSAQRARAEQAEKERDEAIAFMTEAQEEATRQATRADTAESRPLTREVTDEMVLRFWNAFNDVEYGLEDMTLMTIDEVRLGLRAVFTEPPARPEGAEELTVRLRQAGAAIRARLEQDEWNDLADHLAAMGVRATTEGER